MDFEGVSHNSQKVPMSAINMTPMVDVMLVLMVIFILSLPMLSSSLNVQTSRNQASQDSHPPATTLHLDANGQVKANNKNLSKTDLELLLKQLSDEGAAIRLSAHQQVSYLQLAELMTAIQEQGISELQLVTN